jgi:hypothetical protein
MSSRRADRLIWFGVLGGACAWAVQFVANLAFTFAQCDDPAARWQLPLHAWEIALSAAAIIVALAAEATCIVMFLRTYDHDEVAAPERHGDASPPPTGRINSLSMMGMLVNFLALTIILMTAIGAPLLPVCQQS